jgi:hypothetical protein
LITGTTGTVTRGDLEAGVGDNSFWVDNGGDFGVETAAAAAGVTIAATGNEEEKPQETLAIYVERRHEPPHGSA